MQLLDGKLIASQRKAGLAIEAEQLYQITGKRPGLAAILVGSNAASEVYVASKIKACEELHFVSRLIRFEDHVTEAVLLEAIASLNGDPAIDGILVQLPLPEHISVEKVTETISYKKDVDGFHPVNIGRMAKNQSAFISATPYGILKLIEAYALPTAGKHCVVIGRSNIVGSPMSMLMARNDYPGNCTVTLCHSKTVNIEQIAQEADILVAAIGRPLFVTADMVKEGAVVIDVGMNRISDPSKKSGSRLVGDVDFDRVAPKCAYITPVPGGVGLMTIIGLLDNTLKSASHAIYP